MECCVSARKFGNHTFAKFLYFIHNAFIKWKKGTCIMKNSKIIQNRIKCLKCGDVIESKYRHDYKTCSGGACAIDNCTNMC